MTCGVGVGGRFTCGLRVFHIFLRLWVVDISTPQELKWLTDSFALDIPLSERMHKCCINGMSSVLLSTTRGIG